MHGNGIIQSVKRDYKRKIFLKNLKMIIHKAILPNSTYPEPINICHVIINDHNHVLDPNMNHDKTTNAATMMIQYMELAQNDANINFNDGCPIVMCAKQDNLNEIKRRIVEEQYNENTEYEISSILALTVTLNFSSHDNNVNACEMEFNIICSIQKRPETQIEHNFAQNYQDDFMEFQ